MKRQPVKLCTISLLIALAPIGISVFVLVALSIAFALNAGPGSGALFGISILPFILLLVFAIDCAAHMIGIAGIIQKNGNKVAALIGVILSMTPIALLVALFIKS